MFFLHKQQYHISEYVNKSFFEKINFLAELSFCNLIANKYARYNNIRFNRILKIRLLFSMGQRPNNIYHYTLVVYKFDLQLVFDPLDNPQLELDRSIRRNLLDDK